MWQNITCNVFITMLYYLYNIYNKLCYRYIRQYMEAVLMIMRIDFNSDEALYMQLYNQIIIGIANSELQEGENLPSVRELADDIGINMHTVNKAYSILRQEGYLKLDRRKGAVIALDIDKYNASVELMENLKVLMAKAICKGFSSEEVHNMIDEIYSSYGCQ